MPSPTVTVDPTTMYDTGSIAIAQQVAEYLIWVNNDLSLRPVLAESWSPNSTAKVWTFNLRKGVTFQDGKAFGADDVVVTMNILLNPKTVSAALAAFQGILSQGGVQKVDDTHGRLPPRPALRRLPLLRGLDQLRLPDPADDLQGRHLAEQPGRHRAPSR